MFKEFQNIFQLSITLNDFIQNILVAFACGMIIAWFYRKTYRGPGYLTSFVHSIVILAMITSLVIMVIGNNLARAFGLVGAMSIIRFRTAVKETQDIIFIFFALAVGMAAGVGLHSIALTGSVIIGTIALFLTRWENIGGGRQEFLLQFVIAEDSSEDRERYDQILKNYCRDYRLINAKALGDNGDLELSFHVELKDPARSQALIKELKQLPEIRHINMLFDEEQF
ncbi:MAG: DUF4956 domain-containing protein [Caldithrix sp.]|nr:DUF4956 domain-containing protein [Caldithrix sp.]